MKIRSRILCFIAALILLIPLTAFAWSGKCVGVSDGDTISVMHEGKAVKIRLYGIDCPERRQPYGTKAKKFTAEMVFKKIVEVEPVDQDRYGRTIAWVYVDRTCVNKELLRAGLAWHYKRYSKEQELAILEEQARINKGGLWNEANPIAPWEWRRVRRR